MRLLRLCNSRSIIASFILCFAVGLFSTVSLAQQASPAQDAGPAQNAQPAPPEQNQNPGVQNPGVQNPGVQNPGVQNPDRHSEDQHAHEPNAQSPDQNAAPPSQPESGQEEIQINNRPRTFLVHLPQGYDSQQRYPVVILLHDFNQDAAEMARLTHFNELADRDSIIAVYPNAVGGRWAAGGGGETRPYRRGPYRRPGVWGPGYPPPAPPPPDRREGAPRNQDMQFLHGMLDRVATEYSIDTRRIYAVGLGEGGFLAMRLGCNAADRLAAVAAVGASLPQMQNCVPARALPILLMNGTDDPIVHYDGGRYKEGMVRLLSAEDTAKEWARLNHCSEKPAESKLPAQSGGKDTKVFLFDACQENAQVALYSVKNGGHTWPDGEQYMSEKEIGKTSHALNANETIWSFLVTRKIPGESGAER
jgi:polyhydroxybutyrate depolymerase